MTNGNNNNNNNYLLCATGFPGSTSVKELDYRMQVDVRDVGSIPGSGRSSGGGHGNPLQYSRLENPMDRGAWWATVLRVTKSQTVLKRLCTHAQCARYHARLSWIFHWYERVLLNEFSLSTPARPAPASRNRILPAPILPSFTISCLPLKKQDDNTNF